MSELVQNFENPFKAQIIGDPSKIMEKSTGATYVLHTARITEAPEGLEGMIGKTVTASRTLLNSEGVEKEGVENEDEVNLYCQIWKNEDGAKPFFTIQKNTSVTEDADLLGILASANIADQQV